MSDAVARARHSESEALIEVLIADDGRLEASQKSQEADAAVFVGELPAEARDPAIAGRWRHFKGGVYEFVALVRSTPEGELLLYCDASGGVWLRPWRMVLETIARNGEQVPRFTRIDDC